MIAVTGATGFIGSHLAAQLVARGDDVRVLVRDRSRLAPVLAGSVEAVEVDLLDGGAMRQALEGCELLYHVAGMIAGRPRELLWKVNADGPRIAVEAAAAAGLRRVVATSTQTALGPGRRGTEADETTPFRSLGFRYVDSKQAGEVAALEAGRRTGVEVVVTSPAYTLGAPVDLTMVQAPSSRVVSNYLRGRLPMMFDGVTTFAGVEDVAAGHLLAAERGRPGETYVLGAESLRWSELIARVRTLSGVENPVLFLPPWPARRIPGPTVLGRETPGLLESMRLMGHDWAYSCEKARRELGYAPRPIEESLRRSIEWHRALEAAGRFDGAPVRSVDRASAVVAQLGRQPLLGRLIR
jgi:dihydroflavonol-4-reductase